MVALLTQSGTIRADHSICRAFFNCSTGNTGNTYYSSKGVAVSVFEDVLEAYGLCFDSSKTFDFPGPVGRLVIPVHDEFGVTVGNATISWYRVPSSRYEFTGYLT